jgi:type I restriction enzyme, S subunit
MNVKPGYKQTEMGVIPVDWKVSPLGTLSQTSSGTTPARALYDRYYKNGAIAWVKTLDLRNTELFATSERVTELALKETCLRIYPVGTVLIAMYGGFQQIGRTGLLRIPAAVNQAITAIQLKGGALVSEYLLGTLNHRVEYWRTVASSSRKDPNISSQDIRNFPIAYPQPPEQRAIAEALSDVDALLGALDRLIAKKRDLKQAAMQQLLTGQTRLPGFHGEWEVKTLGDLFDFSGGYSASRDQLSKEGHCYLHYGDIHGATKAFVDVRAEYQDIPKLNIPLKRVSSKSKLEDGDVVFVDASEDDEGTSRHVVVVNKANIPFISGLHTIVAKSKTKELAHEYRRYCFQTPAIRQQFLFYSVGKKVSGISKTNIPKLKLPVPSVPEQSAIAGVLEEMDAELARLEQRREKTRALKQAMMQELLTGRTRLL